jgi:hypothetical protein
VGGWGAPAKRMLQFPGQKAQKVQAFDSAGPHMAPHGARIRQGNTSGKSNWYPTRLLMAVVMVVVLPSLVANSTFTETGAPLKGPGSSSLGGGLKAQLGETKKKLASFLLAVGRHNPRSWFLADPHSGTTGGACPPVPGTPGVRGREGKLRPQRVLGVIFRSRG